MLDRFTQIYQSDHVPWDTGITPPEIVAIVKELSAGKALDLGCGTGTTIKHLLENGWQVDGVDFVAAAIAQARKKLASFPAERYTLYQHDVTRLHELSALRVPYNLVIDIGCGHSLQGITATHYAQAIAERTAPGGVLMLYAHLPRADRDIGWSVEDVNRQYTPYFDVIEHTINADTSVDFPAGWYRLHKR